MYWNPSLLASKLELWTGYEWKQSASPMTAFGITLLTHISTQGKMLLGITTQSVSPVSHFWKLQAHSGTSDRILGTFVWRYIDWNSYLNLIRNIQVLDKSIDCVSTVRKDLQLGFKRLKTEKSYMLFNLYVCVGASILSLYSLYGVYVLE